MESSIAHLQPLETNISDLKPEVPVEITPVIMTKKLVVAETEAEPSFLQRNATIIQVAVASLASNYIPSETLVSIPGVSNIFAIVGESPLRTILVLILFLLLQFFIPN